MSDAAWQRLQRRIERCQRCPRLRKHCRHVAREKRAAYRQQTYWGLPVANLGTPPAPLLIVGLAPGAHGANRTGRMFTGDRSGQWLFRALHRAGFANHDGWVDSNDGLKLIDCVITAAAHCAPPGNRPSREELANCRDYLVETLRCVDPRVIVALGGLAWKETQRVLALVGLQTGRATPFAHGAFCHGKTGPSLLASYHPSQQNTFTGRLTEPMLDTVFSKARRLIAGKT